MSANIVEQQREAKLPLP